MTIEHLRRNVGAMESDFYVFSDAPNTPKAEEQVRQVRSYLKTITGFKSVSVVERRENYGLAKSIISGVSEAIEEFGKVIVIEDDLITAPNFLAYMNQALNYYEGHPKVWSISGFSYPLKAFKSIECDATFGYRASSWGWATWKNCWDKVDWDVSDYAEFLHDREAQKKFKRGGSDLCRMLKRQMEGEINSWAIRFCYSQFRHDMFDVYPKISKTASIGFQGDATHTHGMSRRFATSLDIGTCVEFIFCQKVEINQNVARQFAKKFSSLNIVKHKIISTFF